MLHLVLTVRYTGSMCGSLHMPHKCIVHVEISNLSFSCQFVGPLVQALAASGPRPGSPPDLLSLRLLAFPKKLKPLSKLRTQSQESRFIALPSATSAADLLCASISSAVYDALLAPVVSALTPLPGLPEWMAGASAASLAGHVPTFSASPLPLVTSVGEYMMALPQPLEVLIQEDSSSQLSATAAATAATAGSDDVMAGGAAGDELAAEWLDKVRLRHTET